VNDQMNNGNRPDMQDWEAQINDLLDGELSECKSDDHVTGADGVCRAATGHPCTDELAEAKPPEDDGNRTGSWIGAMLVSLLVGCSQGSVVVTESVRSTLSSWTRVCTVA